jgi:hypothetical protein
MGVRDNIVFCCAGLQNIVLGVDVSPAKFLAERPNQVFWTAEQVLPTPSDLECMCEEEQELRFSKSNAANAEAEDIVAKVAAEIDSNFYLDDNQKQQMLNAWKRTFTLLQGPPGTGKTHVISQLVLAITNVLYGKAAGNGGAGKVVSIHAAPLILRQPRSTGFNAPFCFFLVPSVSRNLNLRCVLDRQGAGRSMVLRSRLPSRTRNSATGPRGT